MVKKPSIDRKKKLKENVPSIRFNEIPVKVKEIPPIELKKIIVKIEDNKTKILIIGGIIAFLITNYIVIKQIGNDFIELMNKTQQTRNISINITNETVTSEITIHDCVNICVIRVNGTTECQTTC